MSFSRRRFAEMYSFLPEYHYSCVLVRVYTVCVCVCVLFPCLLGVDRKTRSSIFNVSLSVKVMEGGSKGLALEMKWNHYLYSNSG